MRARACDSAILPSVLPHYCEDSSTAVHSRVSLWGSSSPSHGHPQTPWRTCSHSWGCLRSRPRASLGEDLWGEQHDCTHSWKAHPLCRPGSRRSPLRRHLWHTWMLFLDCLQIQIPHDIWDKSRDPNFVLSCPILKTLQPMRQEKWSPSTAFIFVG